MITITLTPEEAVAVVNVIGQLPTNQSVFPLWNTLREQVERGLQNPPAVEVTAD